MSRITPYLRPAALAASLAIFAAPAALAETPAAAKAVIKKLGISAALQKGWEDEQKVPADWIEKAKKEGTLRIYGSGTTNSSEKCRNPSPSVTPSSSWSIPAAIPPPACKNP